MSRLGYWRYDMDDFSFPHASRVASAPSAKEEKGLFVDTAFRILYRVVLAWMERDPYCGTRIPEAFFE